MDKIEEKVSALVDPGATVNVICRSLVCHLKIEETQTPPLRLADGTASKAPAGEIVLNLCWEEISEEVKFLVFEDPSHPIILGTNWIARVGVVVSLSEAGVMEAKRGGLKLSDLQKNAPKSETNDWLAACMMPEEDKSLSNHLTVRKATVVPAKTLAFIQMDMTSPERKTIGKEEHQFIINRTYSARPGREWIIPSSLITEQEDGLFVPILNLTSRNIRFYAGEELVEAEIAPELQILESTEEFFCSLTQQKESKQGSSEFVTRLVGKMPEEYQACMEQLLNTYEHLFHHETSGPLRSTPHFEHHIDTGDSRPIRSAPYRVSRVERDFIQTQVTEMLNNDVITPSSSPWASPVVMIPKKNGKIRFCIDYRRLNAVTVRDVYPLPRIDDFLDRLGGAKVFSSLDLKSGYWQVPMSSDSRRKTAFITPDGLYECKRLPFGLCNAPATFQRMMDQVLSGLKWTMCLVYLDDLVIYGSTFEEHYERLEAVLTALDQAGLSLNPEKCTFAVKEIACLGHQVTSEGIRPDPSKLAAILEFPSPATYPPHLRLTTLRSFLGIVSYYRRFVEHFASIATPLYRRLKKKAQWTWGNEEETAFQQLKSVLVSAPLLAHHEAEGELELHTDASGYGLGAVLMQKVTTEFHPIAYLSRRLSPAEANYHSNELECLALVWALTKLRPYLYGRTFRVKTDNNVVRWLCQKKEIKGKFARWIIDMQEFDFSIEHLKGIDNRVADALSRHPISEPNLKTEQPSICSLRMDGYSSQEVAFWQQGDPSIKEKVIRLQGLLPTDPKIPTDHSFCLCNGVLYRKNTKENGKKHQLVAPSILRREIIQSCHASATSGHLGVHKTLARITERFWWPNMSVDVRTYVSSCYFCQMHKRPPGGIIGELQPIPIPKKPFSLMGIDHVGPFKLTTRGNRYILVAVDYFSKWVIAKPVPDTSAIFIRDFIHQEVICHHGYPDRIISDRGSALASAYLEEELAHWNIRHSFASAQYPQSNGQVEKMNGTLVMALKAFVNTRHTDWDEKIVDAVIAINTAKQEATEATPFEVVYGRSAELSHERLFPWPESKMERHQDFLKRVADFRTEIHTRLQEKQAKLKNRTDKNRRKQQLFQPGDLVLVARTIRKTRLTKKLLPRYIGPYQVVKKVSPLTYLVEEIPASRKKRVWRRFPAHVSQLKPFCTPQDRIYDHPKKKREKETAVITRSGRRSMRPARFVPGTS